MEQFATSGERAGTAVPVFLYGRKLPSSLSGPPFVVYIVSTFFEDA